MVLVKFNQNNITFHDIIVQLFFIKKLNPDLISNILSYCYYYIIVESYNLDYVCGDVPKGIYLYFNLTSHYNHPTKCIFNTFNEAYTIYTKIKQTGYKYYDKTSDYYDHESVLSDRNALVSAYITDDDEYFIKSIEKKDKHDKFWKNNLTTYNYNCYNISN